jgi:Na+/melibiose symporter-like transporter
MASTERLGMRTKLAFGVGGAAEAAPYIAFNSFNMLFYNNVLGLSGSLCGLAVTIALVFDAIADPIIGFWSDRLRSRLGRRHPFMYAAPLPLAISFYLLYSPPEGLTGYALFAWLTGFTLLFRQALSLYHVPHLALGAELTDDYHQRSVVMSYYSLFGLIGGASAAFFGWRHLEHVPGGQASRVGYFHIGASVALVAALIVFVSAWFTRDQIPRLRQPTGEQVKGSPKLLLAAMVDCLSNRNYRVLLLGLLCLSATIGVRETLTSYTSLFFWELPAGKIKLFALASPPAYVIAFVVTAWLHRRFDKRPIIIAAMLVLIFAVSTPMTFWLLGMMPPKGSSELMRVLLLYHFTFYLGFAMLTISVLSALADVADEHELNTGSRQEAMFYAARTFFGQLSSALGHLLAGIALDVIHFPTGAKPGQVAHEVITQLGWVEGPIGALPSVIAIVFYARFAIGKERLAEVQAALALRRTSATPKPVPAPSPAPTSEEVFAGNA